MMTVISVSLADESLEALDRIQTHLDLGGRSEAVRAAIRMAESEIKDLGALEGDVEGVLIVVHSTHGDQWMNIIQHKYEGMIRTQMHSHLQDRKCLEVLILSGDAGTLERMMKDVYGAGKADYIKFVKSR